MAEDDTVRKAIVDALVISTEAQLRALKRIQQEPAEKLKRKKVGMSQLDVVEDILLAAGEALHINEIIKRAGKSHKILIDRESIVSALTKKVMRKERFARTDKNTFALKGGDE